MIIRVSFDISEHLKVYDILVNNLGFSQECFVTDDLIEIDELDFEFIKLSIPDVKFKVCN